MESKIKFGIYPNPLPDSEGNTTYQVRHEPEATMSKPEFLAHLKYHATFNTAAMSAAMSVLREEIVEQLRMNRRFRFDGIGTLQMKVGLTSDVDDEGNAVTPHITDPKQITARNVEVTGVTFIPDKSFIDDLKEGTTTVNVAGAGNVSGSRHYDRQEVVNVLNSYLAEHGSITRTVFARLLGVSGYTARKWLQLLTTEPYAKFVARKQGNIIIYRRYGQP